MRYFIEFDEGLQLYVVVFTDDMGDKFMDWFATPESALAYAEVVISTQGL